MINKEMIKLLQDSILHLCRVNSLNLLGNVEIDGIVCISSDSCEQQFVVKVHEQFHNDVLEDASDSVSTSKPTVENSSETPNHAGSSDQKSARKRKPTHIASRPGQHSSTSRDSMKKTRLNDREENHTDSIDREVVVKLEPEHSSEAQSCGLLDVIRRGAEGDEGDAMVDLPSWMSAGYQHDQSDTEDPDKCEMVDATYLLPLMKKNSNSECVASPSMKKYIPKLSLKKGHSKQKGEYPCQYCDKVFGWHRTLTRHMNQHLDNRPYVCKYCSKAFHRRDFLRYHIVTHVEPEPHKCGVCNKRFSLRKSTFSHMKKFHAVADCQACSFCFTVLSAAEISAHMEGHAAEDLPTLTCSDCTYTSKSRFQLMEHSMQHFPSVLGPGQQSAADGSLGDAADLDWTIPHLSPVPSDSMTEILSESPPTLQQQDID